MEILLPKMGESVAEATIIKWVVEEGQSVSADDPVIEIATDKVDSEVPAPEDGVLVKHLVSEGDVVQVGQPIAEFSVDGETVTATAPAAEPEAPSPEVMEAVSAPLESAVQEAEPAPAPAAVAPTGKPSRTSGGRFYSPLVRSIAEKEGVSQAELDALPGTGKDGRVTKKDMLAYVQSGRATAPVAAQAVQPVPVPMPASATAPKPVASAPAVSMHGEDEIVEMDRMRKLIADHMVRSVQTSPHVTSFVEADVTRIVDWRNRNKKEFQSQTGQKLTFTPFFIEAVAKALREFPGVNASVDGDRIILKKGIHIGMAAATPEGNLIVPVIRHADRYNLNGLATVVNDLANRARQGALKPDEISGGTYTVSNVGTFGNVFGTPIINQPQVGILALGAIRKKAAVVETPDGDVIAVRHMMFLSHSYDHRVVDGQLGGSFVRRVADHLEAFDPQRPVV
ncbi:MAG: 2-oxo acid dehydrogenase subunit E2 [Crocinitomicaceae bacterium TMED114]|nr:MAG: 2-oxo acid dehydrogenase subunit E2 [Crocinitomicaceae bacterium TMED114]